jgi:hypothetical protein
MASLKQLTYKTIPGFLDQTELDILKQYCKIKHINNFNNFDMIQNNCGDTYFYKDDLMEIIATRKKEKIEKAIGIKLNETYTFWRCYTYGAELVPHKDRPACEISATVCIDGDKLDWPIYMDGKPHILKPGDAIIYNGCKLKHWRKPYDGDYHMQAFFHYVNKKGRYANHKGDSTNQR